MEAMTLSKKIKYSSIESVSYSFEEAEIEEALVALIKKVYKDDHGFRLPKFEIEHDEDGHVVATLTYDHTTEDKDDDKAG